jgi:hypothetical protein
MDTLRNLLKPLIQELPEFFNSDLGVLILAAGIVVIVLIIAAMVLKMVRGGGGSKKNVPAQREQSQELDMNACPMPSKSPPAERLLVQGVPVRLRLVVLAPAGSESDIDLTKVGRLLEDAVAGLGKQYVHDRPTVRIWPVQVSHKGFAPTFFRKSGLPAAKGDLSRWVLLAGRCVLGKKSFLLGLGLWADKPCPLGHLTTDADRWPEVCRFRGRVAEE